MYDEIDIYLGRRLKSWAALQRPPDHGRERLLSSAITPPEREQSRFNRLNLKKWLSHPKSHRVVHRPKSGWVEEPFTQSQTWSFHIATLQHQLA